MQKRAHPSMESVSALIPNPLLAQVRQLIEAARQRVASAVNAELTQLYWHIGRRISAELPAKSWAVMSINYTVRAA